MLAHRESRVFRANLAGNRGFPGFSGVWGCARTTPEPAAETRGHLRARPAPTLETLDLAIWWASSSIPPRTTLRRPDTCPFGEHRLLERSQPGHLRVEDVDVAGDSPRARSSGRLGERETWRCPGLLQARVRSLPTEDSRPAASRRQLPSPTGAPCNRVSPPRGGALLCRSCAPPVLARPSRCRPSPFLIVQPFEMLTNLFEHALQPFVLLWQPPSEIFRRDLEESLDSFESLGE